jgi:PAS domain S-box-containing protein
MNKDEEALKKSEANLRTIFDNTDTSYILIDAEMRIVSFNALAQKYSEENNNRKLEVGTLMTDYFKPERLPFIRQMLDRVVAGETINYELSFPKKNGTTYWYEIRWLNVKNSENANWGFILVNKDITETKLAALEREKIAADLIQHNSDLKQFTYIVSHNLRAPVANIIGLAEILKDEDLDNDTRYQIVDKVCSSIKNIDTVINDLNQILQARELMNERKEMVHFGGLIEAIKANVYTTLPNNYVTFEYSFEEVTGLFTIRSYMYSILYNLVSNSIKYRRPGVPPIISIKTFKRDDKLEIRFKDNGKGIDLEKNRQHLFGLYRRFDTSTEGKGMGLFMVKTQVEALGGTIQIESAVNQGTEFIIQLTI